MIRSLINYKLVARQQGRRDGINNKGFFVIQLRFSSPAVLLVRGFTAKLEPSEEAEASAEKKLRKKSSFFPPETRFQYREFLPDPTHQYRNAVRERLERQDMLRRRQQIFIPEFYVGSVVAVTSSDPHSQGKTNRFVGICIDRQSCGLRANFTLRNVVDNQGLEILFELYDPTLQKVEVLRLEKRLDDKLYYLRDAYPEHSTFDLNMEPEAVPEGTAVPVNELKVRLKPRPWLERWERQDLKGVENVDELLYDKHRRKAAERATPWEKFDLMKEYRRSVPEEEQTRIFSEIFSRLKQQQDEHKKKIKSRRVVSKPQKLG